MGLGTCVWIADKLQFQGGHLAGSFKVSHLQLGQAYASAGLFRRFTLQCLSPFKMGFGLSIVALLQQDRSSPDFPLRGIVLIFSALGDGRVKKWVKKYEKAGDCAVKEVPGHAFQIMRFIS
jgi:hypothetical protein